MAMPAWRAMSTGARLYYIELRGRLRNDYANNGKVFLSCRDGAKAIGARPGTIQRWAAENEHYGFLRKTSEGFLGSDGRGIAPHYRFTEFPCGTQLPTRDFEKWDGGLFVYTPSRPSRKKQNPVTKIVTPRDENRHIRKGSNGASVCNENRHIGSASGCDENRHVSRSTSPVHPRGRHQGSLTARAPAQAGDAGSSPAPVTDPQRHTRESLMQYVANVIDEQLHDLDLQRVRARRRAEAARRPVPFDTDCDTTS
jgi:hypothetical protein